MNPVQYTCCFTGLRPKYFHFSINENHVDCVRIKTFIRDICEHLINEKGVTHFLSGGAVGVDTWAMEEVIKLRIKYPQITLECVLPYAGMLERFALQDRNRYERIEPDLQIITILNKHYHSGCMQQRNIYMVNRARYVIAVWSGQRSGTANTINYAQKCCRRIFCLKMD
ncbi:MAG: DUF1273 domain-containing protein [Planctomycetes bacterium]|nr:DUF1273 domain-containing protein [Planctomycetota bacterium]